MGEVCYHNYQTVYKEISLRLEGTRAHLSALMRGAAPLKHGRSVFYNCDMEGFSFSLGFYADFRITATAAALKLPFVGAPGIVCRSKRDGLIPAVKPLLAQLLKHGIFWRPELVAGVLAHMNE